MLPPNLVGYEFDQQSADEYMQQNKVLILYLAYNKICNLACPFCFSDGGDRATNLMKSMGKATTPLNYGELINLIDQSLDLGIKAICFYGEGEPLLLGYLKTFFDLVDYANKNDVIPVVFTNGTTINKEIAQELFDKNVSVVGKLYSFNTRTNEYLTGNAGVYKYINYKGKTIPDHIPLLLNAGYQNSNRFAVFTVVTNQNLAEIEEIWAWNRENGIIPYADFLYTYRDDNEFGISKEERIDLSKRIYKIDQRAGIDYDFRYGPHLGHRKCNTRLAAIIGVNGEIRICPGVDIFIGNIRDHSLSQLLNERSQTLDEVNFVCESGTYCGAFNYEKAKMESGRDFVWMD